MMDPEYALAEIVRLISDEYIMTFDGNPGKLASSYGELAAHTEALIEWLARSGFQPDWKKASDNL